jgi:hypothetical protein
MGAGFKRAGIMSKDEAMQHGLGYAAGREDASGTPTVEPGTRPGFMAFADAYAEGWDDYNSQRRWYMTNARDAYDTWQATAGLTIFSH